MKRARDLLRDLAGWLRGKVAGIYNEADVYVTGSEWKDKWTEMEVQYIITKWRRVALNHFC